MRNAHTPRATKVAAVLGIIFAVGLQSRATTWATACKRPWIFFDLGNTIVDAKSGTLMNYSAGAHEYLRTLKQRGFRIGLITNVPQKWGPSSKKKISALKQTVAKEWTQDPTKDSMDWTDFSDALILVPPREEYRKPAPYLFRSALSQVILEEGETRCQTVFQGEDPKEVAVAISEGMLGYQVGVNPDAPFYPIEELEKLVKFRP